MISTMTLFFDEFDQQKLTTSSTKFFRPQERIAKANEAVYKPWNVITVATTKVPRDRPFPGVDMVWGRPLKGVSMAWWKFVAVHHGKLCS